MDASKVFKLGFGVICILGLALGAYIIVRPGVFSFEAELDTSAQCVVLFDSGERWKFSIEPGEVKQHLMLLGLPTGAMAHCETAEGVLMADSTACDMWTSHKTSMYVRKPRPSDAYEFC